MQGHRCGQPLPQVPDAAACRYQQLGLLTPEAVHFGQADAIISKRRQVLLEAYAAHPERFVNGPPAPPALPEAAWINPPQPSPASDVEVH